MIKPKQKTKIISKHKTHEKDTGSSEVQVAIFTEQINQLAKHLKKHPWSYIINITYVKKGPPKIEHPLFPIEKSLSCLKHSWKKVDHHKAASDFSQSKFVYDFLNIILFSQHFQHGYIMLP